jgi:hypothetical protein
VSATFRDSLDEQAWIAFAAAALPGAAAYSHVAEAADAMLGKFQRRREESLAQLADERFDSLVQGIIRMEPGMATEQLERRICIHGATPEQVRESVRRLEGEGRIVPCDDGWRVVE